MVPEGGGETIPQPFDQKIGSLTQAEHIELKQQINDWKSQYELLKKKNQTLKQDLDLADQSPAFEEPHQTLEQAIEQMKARCKSDLEKETLHTAQRKVLESLKNHWLGLIVFVESPQVPMDNNTAE